MEAIVYHAVIHLLMGALGFIPLPNKGRRDNFYLGQDWKYSKLPVQIHATAKGIWLLYRCHHHPGQRGLQDQSFQPGTSVLPEQVGARQPAPGKRKKLLSQTRQCQNFAAAALALTGSELEAVGPKTAAQ